MQLLSSVPPCPPPRLLRSLGALGKHLAAEGAVAWDELRPPGEVAGWLGITVCSGESLCKVKSLSEGHELFRSCLDYPGNKLNIVEACQPFLQVWFSRSLRSVNFCHQVQWRSSLALSGKKVGGTSWDRNCSL